MDSARTAALTELLAAAGAGRPAVWSRLLPLVDAALRRLARERLGRGPRPSIGVTDLVHETYLRLLARQDLSFANRRHFYGVVARAMRDLLVDRARRATRQKRGGDRRRVTLCEDLLADRAAADELLAVHAALERLAGEHPAHHEVVLLRYYSGLGIDEVAAALGVSPSTVDRQWRFARAWLRRELDPPESAESPP